MMNFILRSVPTRVLGSAVGVIVLFVYVSPTKQ